MAVLKNGFISGTIGDVVFRRFRDKTVVLLRANYNKTTKQAKDFVRANDIYRTYRTETQEKYNRQIFSALLKYCIHHKEMTNDEIMQKLKEGLFG